MFLLEVWWDALHDFFSLRRVVYLQGVQVLGSSKLELGDCVALVLLDGDLFGFGQVLALSPHDLNEFFQVLDFLWLNRLFSFDLPCFQPLNNNFSLN